ncbi:hypothetical protein [Saccharibacillus alkalitolerans]|uniref:Uncharacterized protein n=1 Tax=Saccharibacillus alkalitolerans TaxID=2705290 RepID=A0ABX0F640_9BACL|nr:hypothetical protein [Saccharibacillus alkalitolerans]NGZ76418.1 hypothetical protein [Saccharibacillus alkalitolerans]
MDMPLGWLFLALPGIALILLGIMYVKKGLLPVPEPYKKHGGGAVADAAARQKTANFAAGVALLIAGAILILFFAAVLSMFPLF